MSATLAPPLAARRLGAVVANAPEGAPFAIGGVAGATPGLAAPGGADVCALAAEPWSDVESLTEVARVMVGAVSPTGGATVDGLGGGVIAPAWRPEAEGGEGGACGGTAEGAVCEGAPFAFGGVVAATPGLAAPGGVEGAGGVCDLATTPWPDVASLAEVARNAVDAGSSAGIGLADGAITPAPTPEADVGESDVGPGGGTADGAEGAGLAETAASGGTVDAPPPIAELATVEGDAGAAAAFGDTRSDFVTGAATAGPPGGVVLRPGLGAASLVGLVATTSPAAGAAAGVGAAPDLAASAGSPIVAFAAGMSPPRGATATAGASACPDEVDGATLVGALESAGTACGTTDAGGARPPAVAAGAGGGTKDDVRAAASGDTPDGIGFVAPSRAPTAVFEAPAVVAATKARSRAPSAARSRPRLSRSSQPGPCRKNSPAFSTPGTETVGAVGAGAAVGGGVSCASHRVRASSAARSRPNTRPSRSTQPGPWRKKLVALAAASSAGEVPNRREPDQPSHQTTRPSASRSATTIQNGGTSYVMPAPRFDGAGSGG